MINRRGRDWRYSRMGEAAHRRRAGPGISWRGPNIMTMHAQVSSPASAPDAGIAFSFPYRPYAAPQTDREYPGQSLGFSVTLTPGAGPGAAEPAAAGLKGAVAFLVDTAHGVVPAATLARMIGCLYLATATGARTGPDAGSGRSAAITVSLANTRGCRIKARVDPPDFEIERTAFGAAHILHEDDILGLYILEIAPHGTIPAHCHRVMRERELILDDGLLQQGRPVARGNAYAWPLGHVHAYHNPTGQPRRILCIDSPRFMPADEVPLPAVPSLVPLAPLTNYLG